MASPEELAPSLPETLPEDFSEWDGEGSAAAKPAHANEWEAWEAAQSLDKTAKPAGQSVERGAAPASLVEAPRVAGSASPAPVVAQQPKDPSNGNGKASAAAKPVTSSEWEAWEAAHTLGKTAKPLTPSIDRKVIASPGVDKPRDIRQTLPPSVSIKQQTDLRNGSSKAAATPKPVTSSEWEAWESGQSLGKTAKPLGPPAERKTIVSPVADKPRVSGSASSAAVAVKQQELTIKPVDGAPNHTSQGPQASNAAMAVQEAPGSPSVAAADEASNSPEPRETSKPQTDDGLIQLFSSKNAEDAEEPKKAKKKWIAVAAVSTCSIVLPLIFMSPLLHHGTRAVVKQSVQPLPAATDSQLETDTPKPSASEPVTQEVPPATTDKQPAAGSQPGNERAEVSPVHVPTKTQAQMMDDQLNAPALIPHSVEKQVAEDAPPPASFGAAGADGMGGASANASVFNGHGLTVVKAAPSKPVVISSGVAIGMLLQKTTPVYPPIAKSARVSGTVVVHAIIAKNGTIRDLHVVSGPAMLQQSALDAVRTWRYRPYKLNNEPTEVETTINVVFNLAG